MKADDGREIVKLEDANDPELVGGKAYSLGKMLRASFNVPPGFVITASAYGRMTPQLEAGILKHFDQLNSTFVAVRSSAANEDGSNDAWAGQLDTFLNTSKETLISNIQKCWDSIKSPRAKSYAEQKSIETGAVSVIVQAMIQGEVSGVAFSVHPVTKNDQQLIIEAGLGLGEAVVSGQITPDSFVVDKLSGDIIEKHIAAQAKKLALNDGKNTWQETGEAGRNQKLNDEKITELSKIIQKLEAYFGLPVDIEWCLFEGRFYILQSRPITTLGV